MTINEFHQMVGKTIMLCQCIENDIKLIYSKMLKGNYVDNYQLVEKKSLGNVVALLKELDQNNHKQWFSESDYDLLFETTGIRNYWAHRAYIEFVYEPENIKAYTKVSNRLSNNYKRLEKLLKDIQSFRLKLF